MDPNGHIYIDEEGKIPAEDKGRLDGYLRARAEADSEKAVRAELAALKAQYEGVRDT